MPRDRRLTDFERAASSSTDASPRQAVRGSPASSGRASAAKTRIERRLRREIGLLRDQMVVRINRARSRAMDFIVATTQLPALTFPSVPAQSETFILHCCGAQVSAGLVRNHAARYDRL